jgi:hypothetical protein
VLHVIVSQSEHNVYVTTGHAHISLLGLPI